MGVLPEYPIVYSIDRLVIIEYEDGVKHCWGEEPSLDLAFSVAEELQSDLRLYSYLSDSLDVHFNELVSSVSPLFSEDAVNFVLIDVILDKIRKLSI